MNQCFVLSQGDLFRIPAPCASQVGTMIELPRAALQAGKLAEMAEFFSFGTNDLTQTTYGLSRDDAGSFLPEYKVASQDPMI